MHVTTTTTSNIILQIMLFAIIWRNRLLKKSQSLSLSSYLKKQHYSSNAFVRNRNSFSFSNSNIGTKRSSSIIIEKRDFGLRISSTSSSIDNDSTIAIEGTGTHEIVQSLSSSSLDNGNNDTIAAAAVPRKFVPFPFKYHQELTLRVAALTNLGLGVCRTSLTDNADIVVLPDDSINTKRNNDTNSNNNSSNITKKDQLWVIMVPNVIPGELITARIYRNHKSYSEADLIKVHELSSHRIASPPCALSTICGGCQYQHISIDYQRHWKQQHVHELFLKNAYIDLTTEGSTATLHATLGTNHTYHYRSKITPHYDSPKRNKKSLEEEGNVLTIGFQQKSSRRIIDVPYCNIATHDINSKMKDVRENTIQSYIHHCDNPPPEETDKRNPKKQKFKKGATLLFRECNEGVITDQNTFITTNVLGLTFQYMAGNFFQNNDYMLPILVQTTLQYATAPSLKKLNYFIDCYCGSGLFALSFSDKFQQCIGIEVNSKAIDEARYNAQLNSISNCHFMAASAEALFKANTLVSTTHNQNSTTTINVNSLPRDETVVMLDPPRKGCSIDFIKQLCKYKPQRIIYMSCDPATQARDVKLILEESGDAYVIKDVQPFDLFPQTRHIECLAVLEKI